MKKSQTTITFFDMTSRLGKEFFQRPAQICARELIGCEFRWGSTSGRIVETEAYAEYGDEACHTFFRESARKFVQTNPAGTAYIYLNYGMYWLTNVLCVDTNNQDRGFVLIRALEPTKGLEKMRQRRNKTKVTDLCSGPGKLSMALGIDGGDHETSFIRYRTKGFFRQGDIENHLIKADKRVGISKATHFEWRFLETGNAHVSVPFGKVK